MKAFVSYLLISFSILCFAQEKPENAFDFWVGNWDAMWYKPDSTKQFGTNSITKVLDSKVIEENFLSPSQNFKGKSLSVYSPSKKTWHQAWTDNQGGYYDFIGIFEGDKKIFSTDTTAQNIQRMVFYNIQENSFTWDWENSTDQGKTYQLSWRIYYTRID